MALLDVWLSRFRLVEVLFLTRETERSPCLVSFSVLIVVLGVPDSVDWLETSDLG